MALIPLKSASNIIIAGPSQSGKTELVYKLINNSNDLFENPFSKVYYFYDVWQKGFNNMNNEMEIIQGLPDESFLRELDPTLHKLLVLDDQQLNALNSSIIAEIFTKYSHHKNLSVILILQNLFHQGKYSRDISLNTHYFILFKNPRDINQIQVLGRQLGMTNHLVKAYTKATKDSYSYLMIDLSPHSNSEYITRTHIFPGEHPTIYKE